MTKLQLLVRGVPEIALADFRDAVVGDIAPRILAAGADRLKVTLTDEVPPRASVIPFSRARIAVLSVWTEHADPARWAAALGAPGGLAVEGYRVEESVPLAYDRDWPDGDRTPGVGLLTIFDRRPGLDDATFLHRWHDGHSALSLALHPLWSYVRNVVLEPVIDGTPVRDAIVEEHFRDRRDLLSARVFFGGALKMLPNMVRVWRDVRRFIDLTTIETYLVSEQHLRS